MVFSNYGYVALDLGQSMIMISINYYEKHGSVWKKLAGTVTLSTLPLS